MRSGGIERDGEWEGEGEGEGEGEEDGEERERVKVSEVGLEGEGVVALV